jgi:chemotaxis protein CheZ
MSTFHIDPKIVGIAEHEIPDAKERLNYVITMTDQAAHKTLNAVERSIPLCEEIDKTANELGMKWGRFIAREISADEFRALSKQINIFFNSLTSNSMKIKEELNGVLIAQDFQDLTGQTIRRVIKMVQDVEESLVKYIKLSSLSVKSSGDRRKDSNSELEGPQIPGSESSGAVKSQDEVDDLLSSLGF